MLSITGSNLTNLTLPQTNLLTSIVVNDNKLTSLDVSKNTELTKLVVYNNNLEGLNLASNTKLQTLHASSNKISSIDLSNNTVLNDIDLSNNNLSCLNLVSNPIRVFLSPQSVKRDKTIGIDEPLELLFSELDANIIPGNVLSVTDATISGDKFTGLRNESRFSYTYATRTGSIQPTDMLVFVVAKFTYEPIISGSPSISPTLTPALTPALTPTPTPTTLPTPSATPTPPSTSVPVITAPQTGDSQNTLLFVMLAILSIAVVSLVLKKHSKI